MIGDRLHRLARRLLHDDTCRAAVEPAIADLQHEAPRGRIWRYRGYVGAGHVMVVALVGDIARDTSGVVAAMAGPGAWRPGLTAFVIASVAMMTPVAWDASTFHASLWLLLPLLFISVVPVAMLPALTAAARAAARATHSTRGFVIAAMIAAALLLASIDQIVTRTNRAFRQIEGRALGIANLRDGTREMSLRQLLASQAPFETLDHATERAREAAQRIGFASSAIAYVLFGVALARTRLSTTAAAMLAIYAAHNALISAFYVEAWAPPVVAAFTFLPTPVLTVAAAATVRRARTVAS